MGFWRSIYDIIGIEYIGEKERKQIERQTHLKYMLCRQIKDGGLRLKPLFILSLIKKKNKKK